VRLVADFSVWQTGEGSAPAVDCAALAAGVDGCFVRFTDWSLYARYGPDKFHAHCIDELRGLGTPVGSYLFPRCYASDPVTQVDAWADNTPEVSMPCMLDPEGPSAGAMRGETLTQWIEGALVRMAERWPRFTPVWYTSASFCSSYGITRAPRVPHILQVAEYHYGSTQFSWAARANWENVAYARYGGPDLPPGAGRYDLWQWSSSVQLPGVPGVADCSFVADDQAWAALTPTAPDPEPSPPPKEWYEDMKHAILPDGRVYLLFGGLRSHVQNPNALQALHNWGLIDGDPTPCNEWDLEPFTDVSQDVVNRLLAGGFQPDQVRQVIGDSLAKWSPPAPATPVDPTSLSTPELMDRLTVLLNEADRRLAKG
jgi:hypothetical protein